MHITTYTFNTVRGEEPYKCTCGSCGKTLRRRAVVENTINPYNRTEDGTPKTRSQVYWDARAAAKVEAARLEGTETICRDCEEKPRRDLLLAMAAAPETEFPKPERYWNSAMHYLEDRKQVEQRHTKCECGAPCCSRWRTSEGYFITELGKKRAAKFQAKPQLVRNADELA